MNETDSITQAVIRLYDVEGCAIKAISKRLQISHSLVTKILVTAGSLETEESRLFDLGYSKEEIMRKLNKSSSAVCCRIPYTKGRYMSDDPSENALNIRRSREKRQKKSADDTE